MLETVPLDQGGASSVDFIGITPSEPMVKAGESATATVVGGNFSNLIIDNSQSWCSIDDRIITIAPPVDTTPGIYLLYINGYNPVGTETFVMRTIITITKADAGTY